MQTTQHALFLNFCEERNRSDVMQKGTNKEIPQY